MEDENNTSVAFDSSSETLQDRLTRMKNIENTIREIGSALDEFERTYNQSKMKEAAAKIKATAPLLKQIAASQEYKEDESLNNMLTKCRKDMKTLFERAKKLKSVADEKGDQDFTSPQKTKEPVIDEEEKRRRETEVKEREKEFEQERRQLENEEKEEIAARLEQQARQQHEEEKQVASTVNRSNFKRGNDIWSAILTEMETKPQNAEEAAANEVSEDYTIVCVGENQSGKSSVLHKILERTDAPVPTTAVEYYYNRRPKKFSTNQSRDIIHLWEVTGGIKKSNMFDIALTHQNIEHSCVFVLIDLSTLEGALETLVSWLELIQTRTEDCFRELRARSENKKIENIKKRNFDLYKDHKDKESLKALDIPVIIVGTKYDVFQDLDVVSRKVAVRNLRAVAHMYGCALVFVSSKEESLTSRLKMMMNNLLLKGPKPKNAITDPNKPLAILAGSDSFDDIHSGSTKSTTVKPWIDSWNSTFVTKGKEKEKTTSNQTVADESSKYPEQMIDIVRTEKERELDRYRKESSQRMKGGAAAPLFSSMFERSMAKSGKKI